mmetsp:Transcript_16646/g.46076  ORF Transcript_16646/g.46076 Transcript_16646/m.46076 type:complete len:222 (+) Transcript_16646:197-862(+)
MCDSGPLISTVGGACASNASAGHARICTPALAATPLASLASHAARPSLGTATSNAELGSGPAPLPGTKRAFSGELAAVVGTEAIIGGRGRSARNASKPEAAPGATGEASSAARGITASSGCRGTSAAGCRVGSGTVPVGGAGADHCTDEPTESAPAPGGLENWSKSARVAREGADGRASAANVGGARASPNDAENAPSRPGAAAAAAGLGPRPEASARVAP